ncbi:methyltransferase domain-containing protein [Lactobacillus sp. YT155]|uniref:class I SAM-dependent methyltransferase n=1 Tax=Lactobacillus sp. YT155 TaxID=3060955 RepID=UPI00265F26BC|nr:class I SAM-dependent methyltransferase [Lactobacillus sp. YT155]MDO1604691.1 methyltransferase domain-containing protein [Lactobacillus sp. YT155]
MKESYTEINSKAIDQWVNEGWEWGQPISHEEYEKAKAGKWDVVLTPQVKVSHNWFAPFIKKDRLDRVKLLGLASGGGQQCPIFQAIGAEVTVLDYAQEQLENEQKVATRENYSIDVVKADMTKRLPFEDNTFDIIFHPVANCYIEDVDHVWNECYRVLKPGGLLIAGMDNGFSYLFDEDGAEPTTIKYQLPYNPLKDSKIMAETLKIDGSVQFSHTMEEQIGGQLKAGFTLTDLLEDRNTEGILKDYFPQYILTRSVKKEG